MGFVPKPTPQQPSEFRNRAMRMQLSVSVKLTSIAFVGRDSAAAEYLPLKGKAIAYEQAVPQTEAAKRHYAGGSCRGGTGVPKKRGCVFWGAPQTRPRSAFTGCEVDPSLAVRTSIQQLMTAILSQRACGTRAGLKPAPTSFATAMCFPSEVCGTLVISPDVASLIRATAAVSAG
jgi:hypothetical protein